MMEEEERLRQEEEAEKKRDEEAKQNAIMESTSKSLSTKINPRTAKSIESERIRSELREKIHSKIEKIMKREEIRAKKPVDIVQEKLTLMQFGDEMLTADDLLDEDKLDKVLAAQEKNDDINNARGSQYGGSIASPTLNKQGSIESPKDSQPKLATEPGKDEQNETIEKSMNDGLDLEDIDENDPKYDKDNSRMIEVVNTGI